MTPRSSPLRHVLAFVVALVFLAIATLVVWSNRTALTTPLLSFAGGCIAAAFAIAAPADFRRAAHAIAPYLPLAARRPTRVPTHANNNNPTETLTNVEVEHV